MAILSKILVTLASAAAVLAQGRIDSLYEVDNNLRGHTIYRPRNMTAYAKMPVVVWGNGACSANGLSHVNFNLEVASWGIVLIAQGEPNQSGSTTAAQMKQAIDWISSNAGKGNYANVDASRIAAAGMSCGGTEAYAMGE
jgi:predicted peptidase